MKAYRKTLKPFTVLHAAFYKTARLLLVPLTEAIEHFHTVRDDPLYFRVELLTGGYERETVRMVKRLIRPGMTVLDIGAHVGYYTRMFARLTGDSGRVLAFEPNPRTCAVLRRNVSMYRNVQPIQLAVADQEGTAVMYDFLESSGGVSFYYDDNKRDWYKNLLSANKEISPRVLNHLPVSTSMVKTTTIDSYWASGELEKADFIKMDIEGAEMSALQGMRRLIQASPDLVMIMEYYPRGLLLIGVEPLEALRRLKELGFRRIMVLEDNRMVDVADQEYMARLVKHLLDSIGRVNILCARNL
jgi:FkbM family methyltransferase